MSQPQTASAQASASLGGGPEDFDPHLGRWRLHSRKLLDVLDPACTEWVEFEGSSEVQPIFGGQGNIEFSRFAYDPPFEGLMLRLFDPETRLWRIWWASTRQPGELAPPVEGRFQDGRGVFVGDEVLPMGPAKVRFEWTGIAEGSPRWEQSFSYDGGQTWAANWVTTSTREA